MSENTQSSKSTSVAAAVLLLLLALFVIGLPSGQIDENTDATEWIPGIPQALHAKNIAPAVEQDYMPEQGAELELEDDSTPALFR